MKQVFMQKNAMSAATICTEEMPVPACSSGSILVANCYSMISPGTESTAVGSSKRDMVVKALSDKEIRQSVVDMVVQDGFRKTVDRVQYEMTKWTPLGYSGAGIAIDVGSQVTGIRVGDLVAHAGQGHAEIIRAAKNLCVPVPNGVSASEAAPVALGSIALQAVRRSEVGVGDTVALIGLGIVGQLAGQLLQSAGARVFATDLLDSRISIATQCGMVTAMRGGENATQMMMDATGGMGVDCVVICAGTNPALLQLACKLARERGRIVIVGGGTLEVPRHDFYMKELDLVISRSYGPGRYDARYEENGVDYPYAYVRWTEQRNMVEFLRLVQAGKVNIKPLITHEFELDQAPDGYRQLMDKPDECMGILLKYPESTGKPLRRSLELRPASPLKTTGEVVGLGVIGCGAFARQFHLPNIKASTRYDLRTLVASTAQSAKEFGLLYAAQRCATDTAEVWNDSQIDATMLFTRDTSHASLACKALTAGKHVFCEKPLAVNREECLSLLEASASGDRLCMTGFNRRFAPMLQQVKSIVTTKQGPKQLYYRVNAGSLPHTSWILDPAQSAGRIIGEACHFIDLFRWLVGDEPIRVTAVTTGVHKADHEIQDVNAIFEFPDHSTATLLYSSIGTSKFPKERLELFTGGLAIAMDDFRELVSKGGASLDIKHRRIDKGHHAELEHFADVIQGKIKPLITIDDGVQATVCCLAVLESIRTGKSIEIENLASTFHTRQSRNPL